MHPQASGFALAFRVRISCLFFSCASCFFFCSKFWFCFVLSQGRGGGRWNSGDALDQPSGICVTDALQLCTSSFLLFVPVAQARLEDQLVAMEEAVLAADRLAEQHAERADALEEKIRSLGRELEVRDVAVAAAQAEVRCAFSEKLQGAFSIQNP